MRNGIVEQRHGRGCSGSERCSCRWSYRVDAPEANSRQAPPASAKEASPIRRRPGRRWQTYSAAWPTESPSVGLPLWPSNTEDWLKVKAAAGRQKSTLAQYRIYVDNYLEPVLGHVRLSDLRAKHVDALLAKMEGEGRGLPTRHRVSAALSSALSTAEKRRLVFSNVCRQEADPTRAHTDPDPSTTESSSLGSWLTFRVTALPRVWRLYAVIGLRKGEGLALTWAVVDFDASTVRIRTIPLCREWSPVVGPSEIVERVSHGGHRCHDPSTAPESPGPPRRREARLGGRLRRHRSCLRPEGRRSFASGVDEQAVSHPCRGSEAAEDPLA